MRSVLAALTAVVACTGAGAAEGIRVGGETVLLRDGPGKGLQATPAVAFGAEGYLVAWREGWHGEGGRARIYAARVDRDGKGLDAKGIEVAPSEAGVQERPRVAFGGGVFLVVWHDLRNGADYDVLGARISSDGGVLDAKPIPIATGPGNQAIPDVASDGKSFVAVWQGVVQEGGVPVYYSFSALLSAAGVRGEPRRLLKYPTPLIAWNGQAYFVVVAQTLRGIRLNASGEPLDKTGLVIVRAAGRRRNTRAVAGGPDRWLVITDRSQPDYWGWGGPGAIQCKLVRSDGTLAPDLAEYIRTLPGNERNTRKCRLYDDWLDVGEKKTRKTWPHGEAAVAWDGSHYVAVWQRHHIERAVMFANCDLMASRVDGWHGLDRDAVAVAASQAGERRPALASDGSGGLLCVYEKHMADGAVRIFARPLRTR